MKFEFKETVKMEETVNIKTVELNFIRNIWKNR